MSLLRMSASVGGGGDAGPRCEPRRRSGGQGRAVRPCRGSPEGATLTAATTTPPFERVRKRYWRASAPAFRTMTRQAPFGELTAPSRQRVRPSPASGAFCDAAPIAPVVAEPGHRVRGEPIVSVGDGSTEWSVAIAMTRIAAESPIEAIVAGPPPAGSAARPPCGAADRDTAYAPPRQARLCPVRASFPPTGEMRGRSDLSRNTSRRTRAGLLISAAATV